MAFEQSDHFDGQRFFNPVGAAPQPFSAVPQMLVEPRQAWPAHVDVTPQRPAPRDGATAVVTFVGHSTFLIQTPAGSLLTDPMFSNRAGPFGALGPRRVRQPAIRFEKLPPVGTVLLSHNHYDHCDLPTLRKLARRFDPTVVTPLGNARLVRSAGIRRVEELDWWDQKTIGRFSIALTPAQHFSARTPFDRNRALWAGFVVRFGDRRIYFAGDTGYAGFFRDIRQRLGPFDLALLPIGAYEPRWFMRAVHMNPAEAVQAHVDLGCPETIGMHFGTFRLAAEGIDEPIQDLDEARQANGIAASRFRVVEFGGSLHIRER